MKDLLISTVQFIFEKSKNINDFADHLSSHGITPYYRNGRLTGVWLGKRKYRFKRTLGINVGALFLKDRLRHREEQLRYLREQSREQDLEQ